MAEEAEGEAKDAKEEKPADERAPDKDVEKEVEKGSRWMPACGLLLAYT